MILIVWLEVCKCNAESIYLSLYAFCFKYVYQKVKSPLFRKAKWSEFKHEKVASKELMEIFSDSKCILDALHKVAGLTIQQLSVWVQRN